MARDLTVEVRQATVTALNVVASPVALLTGLRAYGPAAPTEPEWPFVRVDLPTVSPDSDGCADASRYDFNVHGFAKGDDERAAGQLAAAIAAQLDELSGVIVVTPEAYMRDMVWTGTQIFRDTAEVNGWHAVVGITAFVSG